MYYAVVNGRMATPEAASNNKGPTKRILRRRLRRAEMKILSYELASFL